MLTSRANRSRGSTSSRGAIISTPSAAPAAGTARRRRRPCRPASWRPPASAISRPIGGGRGGGGPAHHPLRGKAKQPPPPPPPTLTLVAFSPSPPLSPATGFLLYS